MTDLGNRSAYGVKSTDNPEFPGGWTCTFEPADLPTDQCEVYHIALKGPGGYFYVYIDNAFYSTSPRGDVNEYDPKQAMKIRPGQTIYFYWNNAIGTIQPQVWIYLRTPAL